MSALRKVLNTAVKRKKIKNNDEASSFANFSLDNSFDIVPQTTATIDAKEASDEGNDERKSYVPFLTVIPTVSESRSDLEAYEYHASTSVRSPPQDANSISSMHVFQMQMELVQLREKIKLLDNGNGESQSELIDLITERDHEISQLNSTIETLKRKLKDVNINFGVLTDEHNSLQENASKLELEKRQIARHLQIREQEVVTLVKRLAGEEERLKEGAILKSKNQSLIKELEDMKAKCDWDDSLRLENKNLKDEVLREKNEKKDLQQEINQMKKQLKECQSQYDSQMDEIKQARNIQNLRIEELTELLKERDTRFESLKNASERAKLDYETKINEEKCNYLRQQHDFDLALSKMKNDLENDIKLMEVELQEKSEKIALLTKKESEQLKKEADLKAKLDSLSVDSENRIALLAQQNIESQNLLVEQTQRADQLCKELKESQQQLDDCTNSKSYLFSELQKMTDLLSNQQNMMQHSENEFSIKLSQAKDGFQRRENEIILKHEQLVETLKREVEERMESLQTDIKSKDLKIVSLEDNTTHQTKLITELQSQLLSLKDDNSHNLRELQLRHDHLREQLSKLEKERSDTVKRLSEELGEKQKEHSILLEKLNTLESSLLDQEEEKQKIIASNTIERNKLQDAINEKEFVMQAHADMLENKNSGLMSEVSELKNQLKSSQEQVWTLSADGTLKSNELMGMQEQLDWMKKKYETDITQYEQKIKLQQIEMSMLENELRRRNEEYVLQLEESVKANLALQEDMKKLNDRNLQLEEKKAFMASEMEEIVTKHQNSITQLSDQNETLRADKENALLQAKNDTESFRRAYEELQSSMANTLLQAERDIDSLSQELHSKEELNLMLSENAAMKDKEINALKFSLAEQKKSAQEAITVKMELEKNLSILKTQNSLLEAEKKTLLMKTDHLDKENEKLKLLIKDMELLAEEKKSEVIGYFQEQLQSKESTIASLQAINTQKEELISSIKEDVVKGKQEAKMLSLESRNNEKIQTDLKNKLHAFDLEKKKEKEILIQESEAMKRMMSEALQKKDDIITDLRDELKSKESIISSLHDSLSKQDGIIGSLKGEVEKHKSDAKQYASAAKDKLERMQKIRRTLEDQLRTHEKENTALTTLLEHSIKERNSLESKILSLKDTMKETELNSAEIVADLEEKVEQLLNKLGNIESSSMKEKENLTNLVTKLQSEIDEVNTQKILLERNLNEEIFDLKSNHNAEILELQAKIAEMKSSISTLLKRRSSQEQILATMRRELDKNKKEHRESVEGLTAEIKRLQFNIEELSSGHSTEIEGMQHTHATLKAKVQVQQDELNRLQATLEDRTQLLGDMVAQNKATNSDLFDARALVADLQEESERHLRAKNEAEYKTALVERTKTEAEDRLAYSLQEERAKRQHLEAEVIRLRDVLENRKSDGKFLMTLERENSILKDKVLRQEQYLKRKLKQEKLLKERLAAFGGGKLSMETCESQSWDLGED
jgi:chromosome segregation ATPase